MLSQWYVRTVVDAHFADMSFVQFEQEESFYYRRRVGIDANMERLKEILGYRTSSPKSHTRTRPSCVVGRVGKRR